MSASSSRWPGGEEEERGGEEEGVGIFWEGEVVLVVEGGEEERGKQGGSRGTNEPKPDRMLLQASRATCVGGREGGKEGGRDESSTHSCCISSALPPSLPP
jgi:hypothetical protein